MQTSRMECFERVSNAMSNPRSSNESIVPTDMDACVLSMLLTLLDFYCLYFDYSISTLSDSYVYTRGLPGKGNANAGRLQSSSFALHLLMAPRSTKSVHKSS